MSTLETKKKKMFQIHFNSDLKEEYRLKGRCWFTLFEICPYVGKYSLISITKSVIL